MSSFPGPAVLGRGVVVRGGAAVPDPWVNAPRVKMDAAVLENPAEVVDRLHRAWVGRVAHVVEWDLADDALAEAESTQVPPWDLDPAFLFPLERLRFLVFTNNYDARDGDPKWWWTVKAAKAGIKDEGELDGLTTDGIPVWIDGGPRQPLAIGSEAVVHGETVELGGSTRVRAPTPPQPGSLADDQLEAVAHAVGPARIIAPAGSGKTMTLVARLRHVLDDRDWPAEHTLVLAYNRRAADELVARLDVGRRLVRTIHSLGWAILQEAKPGLELIGDLDIRNEFNRLVQVPRRPNSDPIGPYLEALDSVRIGLRDPAVVEAQRDDVAGFGDAFDRLRERLYRQSRVDHGEQIYGAIEALLLDPELRSRWQARCRHLLVDEFQDLTPAYLLLIRLVASPQLDVFGVGDDDQVIYGYAGADPNFLIEFDRIFPGAGHHALSVNYRCPPDVVEATTTLLGYNRRRIDKTITAGSSTRTEPGLAVHKGGQDLALTAAKHIGSLLGDGIPATDIAVLTRVNASLIPLKAALQEMDIPTNDLLVAESLNRTTVRALFAWSRLGQQPDAMSRGDVIEAARRPSRGLATLTRELVTRSKIDLEHLVELGTRLEGRQAGRWDDFIDDVEQVAQAASSGITANLIDTLTDKVGLTSSARTLDSSRSNAARSGHVDDLVAVRRAAELHPDLATFQRWLTSMISRSPDRSGVVLSSVHRVKGMEWPHVLVFGVDRGTMPHDLADDLEEERRVFHVAITRAGHKVTIYSDEARPSRYLGELDGSAAPEKRDAPSTSERSKRKSPSMAPQVGDLVTLRGGIKGSISAVEASSIDVVLDGGTIVESKIRDVIALIRPSEVGLDQALFEALRAWRRETSQRNGVPAYVVLHDRTMEEIAAIKPSSEADLAVISGIGPAKLDNYGDEILAVVESCT